MSLKSYLWNGRIESFITDGYANVFLLLSICALLLLCFSPKRKLNLPPGPAGLPFVGYLPFLGKEPFKTFDRLSRKYGNVFSLYLGPKFVVVLGSYPVVKEALNKQATLYRPPGIFDFQPDGFGLNNSNGETWLKMKRFVLRTMRDLGLGRSTWEVLVADEVSDFLEFIGNTRGEPIDIDEPLASSVSNNITSLVFGKRLPPGPNRDTLNSAVQAAMMFFTHGSLWNFFPWLCNVLVKLKIGSYHKFFSEMAGLNSFVRNEIEIHRKSQDYSKGTDFLAHFLEAMESDQGKTQNTIFTEKNLIGNSQGLFVAGSETTKASLNWLFLAMAAYPHAQQKVHQELDSVLGRQRKALWEDRSKLPYTYAAILEAQRWKTIAPLNLARMASENFKLCSYDVPKGSVIIANIWALHNDSRYWEEPEEYIPERFLLNEGKDVNLKLESYAPFSLGKRKCPGDNVAMLEMFTYFTAIMQLYEIRTPNGGKPNLDAVIGLAYMPVTKTFCFVPR